MAIDLDGFDVLGAIARSPSAFHDVRADVGKYARALVVGQLKKRPELDAVRAVNDALGKSAFSLVVDGMKDAEVKTLLGKLDKNHPELKGATSEWRRDHLRRLATGAADPTAKAAPVAKSKERAGKRAKDPRGFLTSEAMAAVRKR
jgi:hypothetical protein